jgi:alpha-galactosidase
VPGIKPVADFVHSLGLKFGLCEEAASPRPKPLPSAAASSRTRVMLLCGRRRYTSVGSLTCHHGWSPGSFGHYQQDADLFASWGVDVRHPRADLPSSSGLECDVSRLAVQYVKMDWCGDNKTLDAAGRSEGHLNFSRALNATGRHMAFELCRGPYEKLAGWGYAPSVAQLWRADGVQQLMHPCGRCWLVFTSGSPVLIIIESLSRPSNTHAQAITTTRSRTRWSSWQRSRASQTSQSLSGGPTWT